MYRSLMLALLFQLCVLDVDVGSVVADVGVHSTLMLTVLLQVWVFIRH